MNIQTWKKWWVSQWQKEYVDNDKAEDRGQLWTQDSTSEMFDFNVLVHISDPILVLIIASWQTLERNVHLPEKS